MCFFAAGKEESGNKTIKQPLHPRPISSQERSTKLPYGRRTISLLTWTLIIISLTIRLPNQMSQNPQGWRDAETNDQKTFGDRRKLTNRTNLTESKYTWVSEIKYNMRVCCRTQTKENITYETYNERNTKKDKRYMIKALLRDNTKRTRFINNNNYTRSFQRLYIRYYIPSIRI